MALSSGLFLARSLGPLQEPCSLPWASLLPSLLSVRRSLLLPSLLSRLVSGLRSRVLWASFSLALSLVLPLSCGCPGKASRSMQNWLGRDMLSPVRSRSSRKPSTSQPLTAGPLCSLGLSAWQGDCPVQGRSKRGSARRAARPRDARPSSPRSPRCHKAGNVETSDLGFWRFLS